MVNLNAGSSLRKKRSIRTLGSTRRVFGGILAPERNSEVQVSSRRRRESLTVSNQISVTLPPFWRTLS